jgi:hypothetical protein
MYKNTLKRFVDIHNMSRLTCTWPHPKERKIKEVREALDTFATPKPAWYGCATSDMDALTSSMTSADYTTSELFLALRYVFLMVKIQSFYIICKHTLKRSVDIHLQVTSLKNIPYFTNSKRKILFHKYFRILFQDAIREPSHMPIPNQIDKLCDMSSATYRTTVQKKDLSDQGPLHRISHDRLSNW